jgi:hypothetical protein
LKASFICPVDGKVSAVVNTVVIDVVAPLMVADLVVEAKMEFG